MTITMKIFKDWAIVFSIFLSFAVVLSCRQGEENQKVDLDKRVSDVSQLVKPTGMDKSLKFCFDLRLDPREEIRIYGSFLDYLEKKTGLDFTLLLNSVIFKKVGNVHKLWHLFFC